MENIQKYIVTKDDNVIKKFIKQQNATNFIEQLKNEDTNNEHTYDVVHQKRKGRKPKQNKKKDKQITVRLTSFAYNWTKKEKNGVKRNISEMIERLAKNEDIDDFLF